MSIAQTILEKIGFINNGQPAINDTNLNKMQTNIQNALDDARTKTENAIPEIVDNLTTEDDTKALSANMGNKLIEQNILWDDYLYMDAIQTINVPIAEQKHGIMLMFCAYSDGSPNNSNWSNHVVLKKEAEILNGGGRMFPMGGTQGVDATKYIYIYPDKIEGNEENSTGTARNYVLRKIIGF